SFGLTTLRNKHIEIVGEHLRFQFRGKGGRPNAVALRDRHLARVVRRCRDVPGQDLFQYLDGAGQRQTVSSGDVNAYLRDIAGEAFTAKDFRTWAGTVLAAHALASEGAPRTAAEANRKLVRAIRHVAERLGNTAAVCRKAYVHPEIIRAY